MALVVADKVKVRSYGIGTGEFQLETVIPGFRSFAAIGDGNETYYGIEDSAGNWEVGRGTYSTDSTAEYLSRDAVLSSSNNNNLVNFSDGGKTVFCTIPATVLNNIVSDAVSDSFKTISVAEQSNVVAESSTDTLTLVAGSNIDITTNATADSITIANNLLAVDQDILPSVDSDGTTGYTLGSPSFKWKELFVSNGSIYIGDVKLSNVAGKLRAVKVVNPGEDDEAEDPEDSDAASEIGGGGANTGDITFNDSDIGSETSGNFVNLDVDGEEWMRLGTSGSEKVQIITGYNGEDTKTWEFGTNGVLTFPSGNMSIGSQEGAEFIQGSTDTFVGIVSQGTGGSSVLQWVNDSEETTATAAVAVNSPFGEGFGNVEILTGDIGQSGPEHIWTFNNTGGLRFPDNTVQTTAYTGGGDNSYTPEDTDNWNEPAVNTIQAALDELAARVTALQNYEIDGGNAYTPPEGELLIDGNGA